MRATPQMGIFHQPLTERPLEPDPGYTGVGKRRNGTFGTAAPLVSGVAVFLSEKN
jgi:hypothetical protein